MVDACSTPFSNEYLRSNVNHTLHLALIHIQTSVSKTYCKIPIHSVIGIARPHIICDKTALMLNQCFTEKRGICT